MRKVILASLAMLCVVACGTSPEQKMTSLQQQAIKWITPKAISSFSGEDPGC